MFHVKQNMNTIQNCPVCNKTKFHDFLHCADNTGSTETFQIVKCNHCNFTFTNPIPPENEIGKYYQSDEYISHSNTKKGLISSLYQTVRNYTLDKKISLLKRLGADQTLLDIGCGTGEFLDRAQKANYQVTGIEPSTTAAQQAKENYSLNVFHESHLNQLQDSSFDYITMWHVLEHVYHLNERIATLKRLIKPKGFIIIAVPNLESYDAKKYKQYWAAYDVPRHLYHFSPQSMENLMEKHNLKIQEVLPMKFDSFYVSMLSEKYKTGKVNLISAFLTGLKSNRVGINDKTYSSQIYIIKKG